MTKFESDSKPGNGMLDEPCSQPLQSLGKTNHKQDASFKGENRLAMEEKSMYMAMMMWKRA
jgi:hypothetical protein